MNLEDLNTPLWQLTKGDLIEIISEYIKPPEQPKNPTQCNENLVYGISGIASLLGCSKTMVHEYRRQGWIKPVLKQRGRKIICDASLVQELYDEYKKR